MSSFHCHVRSHADHPGYEPLRKTFAHNGEVKFTAWDWIGRALIALFLGALVFLIGIWR